MPPLDVCSEPVAQRLTWTLLHFLWQGLAVAVLLAPALRLFAVRRARARYATCLAAMLAMAACPLVTFALLGDNAGNVERRATQWSPSIASREAELRPSLPAAGGRREPVDEVAIAPEPVGPRRDTIRDEQAAADRPIAAVDQPAVAEDVGLYPALHPLRRFMGVVQPYLLAGWIVGVAMLGVRLLLGQVGVQWVRRGRRPIPPELTSCVARLGERLGLRAVARVFMSAKVREAVVVGLLRPMVLLPACWLTEMTPEVLEAVIAHELAHIRRWDLWVNLLQRLLETLLFYHPAVWWLSRRVRLAREMCCDELAVAATGQRMSYAIALSEAACRRAAPNEPLLGATMGGTEMTLLSRVYNVLGLSPGRERARWWPAGLLALLVPLGIWCASAGITRPGSGEAQAEEKGQPDRRSGLKVAAFDSVSMSVKSGLGRQPQQHVEIKADGSCLYRIEERPARGEQERWPPARLVSHLDAKRLRQLQELLEKTVWLTAPGGEGPAMHTDADEYKIALVREGKTRSITCEGERPEPYRSLIWFFRGLMYQENLLYRLGWLPYRERLDACRNIRAHVESLEGKSGVMYPIFDIDYTRYLPTFTRVVRNPFGGGNEEELVTAIQLVTFLRAESEFEHVAAMSHDRDGAVRAAVAMALVGFGGQRAVPVLAKMARSTDGAVWGLIRLGEMAVPSIAEMVQQTGSLDDWLVSERIVRGYLEHWNELPGPVDERVVAAVRKALAAPPNDSTRTEYHRGFLEAVESRPVPAGDLSCRVDYQTVYCPQPVRLIHGWYTVADGKIVEHGAGSTPEPGTKVFGLEYEVAVDGGRPRVRAGWRPVRGPAGEQPRPVVTENVIDVPQGTQLEVVYQYYRDRPKLANDYSPFRVSTQYRTLWEGRLVKDGQALKRIVYVARVASPLDPAQQFAPPAAPAATKAEPPKPPRQVTFRGMDLTNAPRVSDPKVLEDLEMARRNDAIKAAGGEVREATQAVVVYKSPEEKAPGQEFVVFHDAKQRLFYILVTLREVGKSIESQYCGPFEGDPFQKLGLPVAPGDGAAVAPKHSPPEAVLTVRRWLVAS
jgi:beta-lactamase regulating signal transducer with metallopeptidase domain